MDFLTLRLEGTRVEKEEIKRALRGSFINKTLCGCSSAGRALPCQGKCREFEPLRPLSSTGK